MKFFAFVIVAVCYIARSSEDQTEQWVKEHQEIVEGCIKETKVDRALVEKLFKKKEYTEDGSLKCFVKCIFVKIGSMTEAGEVNIDNIRLISTKFLGEETTSRAMQKCSNLKGVDACETAFIIDKCFTSMV